MGFGYRADEACAAFRLDMKRMVTDGEVWRFHQLVSLAKSMQWHEESPLRRIYAELIAADALIRFVAPHAAPEFA